MKSGFRYESNRIDYGGGPDYGSQMLTMKESLVAEPEMLDAGGHGKQAFATASMVAKEDANPSSMGEAPDRSGV
jgi:hypothetical protein